MSENQTYIAFKPIFSPKMYNSDNKYLPLVFKKSSFNKKI